MRPAAATGWKSPRRAEKAGGSRPPFRPARSFSSGDGPGEGLELHARKSAAQCRIKDKARRSGAKHPQSGPKNSPGKERRPAPWARTGQGSRSGPRPAAAGGRSNFPNRPGAGPAVRQDLRRRLPGVNVRPRHARYNRAGERPENRQSAPHGAQKRPQTGPRDERRPAPWARTGPASRSTSRPASAAGRGNFPRRPGASPAPSARISAACWGPTSPQGTMGSWRSTAFGLLSS